MVLWLKAEHWHSGKGTRRESTIGVNEKAGPEHSKLHSAHISLICIYKKNFYTFIQTKYLNMPLRRTRTRKTAFNVFAAFLSSDNNTQ